MWKRCLILLAWSVSFVLIARADETEASFSDFSGGLYSNQSGNRIPDNAVTAMENFYSDIPGELIERNGYQRRDSTILGGTKAVTGLWEFVANDGQQWIISFSSQSYYKNTLGNTPTKFGQNTTVNTPPDCAVNLGKIWCQNGTDNLWWFDGTSTGTVSSAPKGTLIKAWRTRLVTANIAGSQSTVRFSGDGDGTSWSIGGNPTDPFSIQIGGANDGFPITCLWGSYLDNLIIARKKDTWYTAGFDQSDVETRNISKEIGCIQAGTMREFDGSLLFLSNRGMEEMRGITITPISEPIRDITDQLIKNTASVRSTTLDSQDDFAPGSSSPSLWISTTNSAGSVVLSTTVYVAIGTDTTEGDFEAGTLTTLDSTTTVGSLSLRLNGSSNTLANFPTAQNSSCANLCSGPYYQALKFTSTDTFVLDSITFLLFPGGSPSDFDLLLKTDNSGSPGTTLLDAQINTGNLSPGFNSFNVSANPSAGFTDGIIGIVSGTSYWLQVSPKGFCDGSNNIAWWGTATGSTSGQACGSSASGTTKYGYIISGRRYNPSGNIVSRSFDVGFTTNTWVWNWGNFIATASVPSGATLTYETQTSSASTGPWDSLVPVSTATVSTSTAREFIRYKASFATTNSSTSPFLSSVVLNTGALIRPVATYTSPVVSIGSLISAWGSMTINDAENGGNIDYSFNASSSPTVAEFNSSSWTSLVSGGVPTNGINSYAIFRGSFSVTLGTQTPTLNSFQFSWGEGGTGSQPLISWNFDRRYWLSYTTSSASGARLDRSLIYQRNRTWTIFKIPASSFATWKDKLYFGESGDTGLVHNFDVGNTDDGASITSILRTKSYDFGYFHRPKSFHNAYLNYFGNTAFTGSFTLTYDLERSGNAYSLGTGAMSESTGQILSKFPFPMSNPIDGREIQYTLIKSGTGDRLRLYDIRTLYELEEAL